jgi:hypothetical protein
MQSDLRQLGIYQPPRRARDPPVVIVIQRLGGSRTFFNFSNMLAQLSNAMPRAATMTVFWGNETLRETARLFGSASIVFGYHGAGFSNLVFSKPATFAVEMFTRSCRSKQFGFTVSRMSNTTGVHFKTLYLGTPFRDAWTEDTRAGAACKPRYIAWDQQDLQELSTCINEALTRR